MSEYDEQADGAPGATEESGPDTAEQTDAVRDMADDAAEDGWDAPGTGVPAVDDVLASVQALDDRPVEEHVAVFEQAHEGLRRALDPGHG